GKRPSAQQRVQLSGDPHAGGHLDRRGGHSSPPTRRALGSEEPTPGSLPGERGRDLRGGPPRVSQESDPRPPPPAREQRLRGRGQLKDLGTDVLPILDGRQTIPLTPGS